MIYEVFVSGGASIEISEKEYKALHWHIKMNNEKMFMLYDEFDNMRATIIKANISIIKPKS